VGTWKAKISKKKEKTRNKSTQTNRLHCLREEKHSWKGKGSESGVGWVGENNKIIRDDDGCYLTRGGWCSALRR